MIENIKNFHETEIQLSKSADAFVKIVGFIRTYYVMDEFWDGKDELKFRRSGKTLVTIYIKDGFFTVLLIFGKKEREKFEQSSYNFSDTIKHYYDDSKTYHDGKWMFINIHDSSIVEDIINMLRIKKNPNRKEDLSKAKMGKCGYRCDLCLLYIGNNEATKGNVLFHEGDWKCYHNHHTEERVDYSNHICNGCRADCSVVQCVTEKGLNNCGECDYKNCPTGKDAHTNPGRCNLGLSADDVTQLIIPYSNWERFDKMKERPE